MYDNLRRELRAAELERKVYYCEPEIRAFFDEEEGKDAEEKIIDSFLNSWSSSDQHGNVETKASNEEIYVFESNILCMIGGDEEHLNDVLMQVDEEVRLLDEAFEIEKFFIEHMLIDVEKDVELPQRDEAEKIPIDEVMDISLLTKEAYEKTSVLHEDHEEDGDGKLPTTVLKIVEEDMRDIDDLAVELNLLEDWLDYEDCQQMVSMGNTNMIDCSNKSEDWSMEFLLQQGGIIQKEALEGNEEVHEEI